MGPLATASAVPSVFEPVSPSNIAVNTRNTSALVTWEAPANADFVVEVAPDENFASAQRIPAAEDKVAISDLDPETTYYVRLRSAEEGDISEPTEPVAFTTGAPVYTLAAPVVKLDTSIAMKATLKWDAADSDEVLAYELAFGPDKDALQETVQVIEKTKITFEDLEAGTYYAQARVVDAEGKPASEWSLVVDGEVVDNVPLVVGTYNVKCVRCGGKSWKSRKAAVAATIKGQMPDVVGIQEASQARSIRQFDQLINLVGGAYKGTKQRISGATDGIIYNSDTVKVVEEGTEKLESGKSDRRLAWAVFEQKSTGKLFLFGSAHLEPNGGKAMANRRARQAKECVATLKAINARYGGELPTFMVGDFNTYPRKSGSNAAYYVFTDAFLDPIGQSSDPGVAEPEKKIHANYSSYNRYSRNPPKYGTYIDYIMVTPMRVLEWETVVKVNSKGRFVGTIPSDHNMLRATVLLP
ncbi:MAG: fibronectin type III domain-containing protein [Propionibacteriaceae bacterium]|nr:fibronectin type III domain-containing protein [Propionibacteriaceae bacterium]